VNQRLLVTLLLLSVSSCVVDLNGCTAARHEVLAVTETNIGVDVGQTPSSQTPHAKLGFQRVETAVVPTNRSASEDAGNAPGGAASNADVIMELRYSGIFSMGSDSGLYQRLAVGKEAVEQPGAAALFIRNSSGSLDPNATEALKELTKLQLPSTTLVEIQRLTKCYFRSTADAQTKMTAAAGGDFTKFVDSSPSADQINAVMAAGNCK
jgi:hypothetical protein